MAETTSPLSKQPSKEIFQDTITEIEVVYNRNRGSLPYVEKDLYAVQVLQVITNYKGDKFLPVFFCEQIYFRANVRVDFSLSNIKGFIEKSDQVSFKDAISSLKSIISMLQT